MEKVCFKCGRLLPLEQFYKHPAMKDGHLNKCIDCNIKDVTEHREKNLERIREYDRMRGRTEKRKQKNKDYLKAHPEKRYEYTKRYRATHPGTNAAHSAAEQGKKKGFITVEKCVVCGSKENLQMHHHDYKQKTSVIALCPKCHGAVHRKYDPLKLDVEKLLEVRNETA